MPIADPDPAAADEQARTRVPLALEDWLTVAIMALLALITFGNVLVRYFSSSSFAWTEEISVFLMILLTMVGASAAVARHRHIRIGFFSDRGSARRQQVLATFGAAVVALLFAVIAVLSARVTWDDIRFEETSPGLGVPEWWYSIWLPVVSTVIVLRAVGLMRRGGHVVTGDTPGSTPWETKPMAPLDADDDA